MMSHQWAREVQFCFLILSYELSLVTYKYVSSLDPPESFAEFCMKKWKSFVLSMRKIL